MLIHQGSLRAMAEVAAWCVGRRQRVRVVGPSMEPTLLEGEFVLVKRNVAPPAGSIVVARHPDDPSLLVVKRVSAFVEDSGLMMLSSDNPESGTDSRTWGPLPTQSMIGLVTIVLDRPTVVLA